MTTTRLRGLGGGIEVGQWAIPSGNLTDLDSLPLFGQEWLCPDALGNYYRATAYGTTIKKYDSSFSLLWEYDIPVGSSFGVTNLSENSVKINSDSSLLCAPIGVSNFQNGTLDLLSGVVVVDKNGNEQWADIGYYESVLDGRKRSPRSANFDTDGNVYLIFETNVTDVARSQSGRVFVYDSSGTFVRSFDLPTIGSGYYPTGLGVILSPELILASATNGSLYKLATFDSLDGAFTGDSTEYTLGFQYTSDQAGKVYASSIQHLSCFDNNLNLMWEFTENTSSPYAITYVDGLSCIPGFVGICGHSKVGKFPASSLVVY